jgi:hypothetical protein
VPAGAAELASARSRASASGVARGRARVATAGR